jgi:putative transposase
MDESSLSHTRWDCKYHIVFSPKFRRKEIYGKLKRDIGKILRDLCERKEVEILEANACVDHIHMLLKIPPKMSVSSFMGYLKGKSTLIIFERHANLKYKYGNRHFWCKGYYVSTVGLNKAKISKYIREQQDEDMIKDKMSIKEYVDPFKGSR